jgi:predicted dehydrogenase
MKASLNWGVIGTGGIAADFAQALAASSQGVLVSVVGSGPEKARSFATRWGVRHAANSVDEFAEDPSVDAVYVASPHTAHEAHALACINAGKHVLCEKPLCVNAPAAERVIAAARERRVLLMEAFMYRCHPLIGDLCARVQAGVIGQVRHLRADFGFRVERDPRHRLFDPALGGGAILDVGGYPVSFARLLAGLVEGAPFAEPVRIEATGYRGPTEADELASLLLTFQSGFTAHLTCAVFHDLGTRATVYGDLGKLELPDPWIPQGQRQASASSFEVLRYGVAPELVRIDPGKPVYALEAELFADTLPNLEPAWPAMSHADTLGNLRVLDAWRARLT